MSIPLRCSVGGMCAWRVIVGLVACSVYTGGRELASSVERHKYVPPFLESGEHDAPPRQTTNTTTENARRLPVMRDSASPCEKRQKYP